MLIGISDDDVHIITSFNTLTFEYDKDNVYIIRFGTPSGDYLTAVETCDGEEIKIDSLKCKTYNELCVMLDLHNVFIYSQLNVSSSSKCSISEKKLMCKVERLEQENLELKMKLQKVKEFLNSKIERVEAWLQEKARQH